MKTLSWLDLVVRYDLFDPNRFIEGKDISKANGFSKADIAYSAIGTGLRLQPADYLSITAYYDHVMNEAVNGNLGVYTENVKDDVFTFRVQVVY